MPASAQISQNYRCMVDTRVYDRDSYVEPGKGVSMIHTCYLHQWPLHELLLCFFDKAYEYT